jgi:hypothetical protein
MPTNDVLAMLATTLVVVLACVLTVLMAPATERHDPATFAA